MMPNPNLKAGPGRTPGTKNQTGRIREMFANMGYDPIYEMAKMAVDPKTGAKLSAVLHRECAKYVAPQLRSIEVTGEAGGPLATRIQIVSKLKEDDES